MVDMLEITETKIRKWASEISTNNLAFAEQDFRLIQILQAIYSDEFLADRLSLKGGTAINKLFLRETPRLSVDLDFNAIGEKEELMKERRKIKDRLVDLLKEQDPGYRIRTKTKYELTMAHANYTPLFGIMQPIKIEISFVERFPVLKRVEKEMTLPLSDEKFLVTTYQLEELASTKIRALYYRLKGRDVYDLNHISKFELNKEILRKLVLYYFYRSRKVFNADLLFKNMENKFKSKKFVDDVSGFVRTNVKFKLEEAIEQIIAHYSFLRELDERDENFLALARFLLKESVSKEKLEIISKIKYPLRDLFGEVEITDFAKNATVKDIKIFFK